jgi:hypothetical protein
MWLYCHSTVYFGLVFFVLESFFRHGQTYVKRSLFTGTLHIRSKNPQIRFYDHYSEDLLLQKSIITELNDVTTLLRSTGFALRADGHISEQNKRTG